MLADAPPAAAPAERSPANRSSANRSPLSRSPPSRWPLAYFAFAHLSLAAAGAWLALQPWTFAGAVYHPHAMVPVHLVTLGWITSSILGSLYLVAPMALRVRLGPSRADAWAFALFVVGVSGMVAHFFLFEYSGMVGSGVAVVSAVGLVAGRVLPGLWRASVATAVKVLVSLAFVDFAGAFVLGSLAGLGKLGLDPPGEQLPTVWSHAHLAALGWATLMVIGIGLRLVPMLLPSAMPAGRRPLVAGLTFAAGTWLLAGGLFVASRATTVAGAAVAAAGVVLVARELAWMRRHPRPPARGLPRPRLPLAHLGQAFVYLAAAAILGLGLALFDGGPLLRPRWMALYAACGLVGFLGQMIVGVASRLWPLYAWQRAFAAAGFTPPARSPHDLVDLRFRWAVLVCWTLATPLLLAGLAWHLPLAVGWAGLALFAAATIDAVDGRRMLRRAEAAR